MRLAKLTLITISLLFVTSTQFIRSDNPPTAPETLPCDVSCCIADIKFDGNKVKVCELGLCTWSYFKGHEQLYGKGKIWEAVWNHLGTFGIPIWYISPQALSEAKREEAAIDTLTTRGGSIVESLAALHNTLGQGSAPGEAHDIKSYKGIVVLRYHHHKQTKEQIAEFKKNHPEVLFLDTAASRYVNNKHKTNELFADPALALLKPDWRLYEKKQPKEAIKNIAASFNHDMYVIKPVCSSEGRGIIMTKREQLPDTLKALFTNTEELRKMKDPAFLHWRKDASASFLLEEYAPSKAVTVKGNQYDATMRVVFALNNNKQQVTATILGYYWKLPTHHLHEEASLTDKHKSKVAAKRTSSAIVSDDDQKKVAEIMHTYLPTLYKKML